MLRGEHDKSDRSLQLTCARFGDAQARCQMAADDTHHDGLFVDEDRAGTHS